MACLSRARNTANLSVGIAEYKRSVQSWLTKPPIVSLHARCGSKWAKELRAVTPSLVEPCLPLVEDLLRTGLASAVLQTSKLELAIRQVLAENPLISDYDGEASLDTLAHDAASHIQAIFGLIRSLKLEEVTAPGPGSRRYPKTGGYRRSITSSHWKLLKPALDLVQVTPTSSSFEVPSLSTWAAATDKDEDGFPTIF